MVEIPDSRAGGWGAIDGKEFLNSERTIAYIKNFSLPLSIDDGCWCASIQELLNCGPATGYNYPSTDTAPWYDPSIPESGDFLGFLPVEFDGLGSTYTRPTFENLNGGALLGRLRPKARTLTWKGFLFGRTCCAAQYGLEWLTAQLASAGGCDGCDGSQLDVLFCCPQVSGAAPLDLTCGPGQAPAMGVVAAKDAFRTFYNVGLVDGPHQTKTRQIGCGNCNQEPGCLIEAEFSLICGNPFMHRDPVVACGPTLFPSCGVCPGDADTTFWKKVQPATYPATSADADLCDSLLECQATPGDCATDPNCPTPALPTIPKFTDPCGCDAYNTSEICCHVSNDIYGQYFEGIPEITIFAGSLPLHNVTVRFYEDPLELGCDSKTLFDICNLCDSATIKYIPANSTMTIDGLTRQINVTCPGDNVQSGESLVSSVYKWPTFKCIDYIVKIAADCNFPIAPNASATVCVIPREM